MAHANINERRIYVKSIMETGEMSRVQIKETAAKFSCSYSAVFADIAAIKSKGEYTIYPGRNIKDAVLSRDNYICQYCCMANQNLFVDHVIPTSMGGVGYEYNLVAACPGCNRRKGRKVWVPLNIEVIKKLNPVWFMKILSFVNK